jgi:glutamyl-Q tRNA(Asp) synthetase
LSPAGEPIYPGTCRNGLPRGRDARAFRLRVGDEEIEFEDAVQGTVRQSLAREVGDFVLKRADGWFAYQLAVVVDDAAQGITDVVRGADLLGSTARQIALQRVLGFPTPRYAHVPVATNAAGEKLSKQTLAPPIESASASQQLVEALRFLGQSPAQELARATPSDIWAWTREHWSLARVPRRLWAPAPQVSAG